MFKGKSILVTGFIIMSFNSLYQYTWNAFLPHLTSGFKVSLPEIEIAFTLFSIFSTFSQVAGGSIADYRGPRGIGIISAILSAIGFLGSSFSTSIYEFYVFWSLGSIGEGILYGIALNLAVKWFSKNRGFATGFVSLGFGLGSAIINPFIYPIQNFRLPMMIIGLVEILVLPSLLYFIDYPTKLKGEEPKEVIKTGKWWLIYFSFVLSTVPLNIFSSSLSVFANGNTLFLITIFPLLSGISRPILGYLSDIIGRVKITFITIFMIILGSILFLLKFLLPSVLLIGFFGGSVLTLFFSITGDLFGEKYSTANTAILYTGKAVSGVLGSFIFSLLLQFNITIAKGFVLISAIISLLLLVLLQLPKRHYQHI